MSDTYFRLSDEDDEGGRYLATEHTVGPWDTGAEHGGPPCALLTRSAERRAAALTGRAELEWDSWSFANVDLDVHLARSVFGEWLYLDATTRLGPSGFALARSTLSDTRGDVGATAQTLVLAPRA